MQPECQCAASVNEFQSGIHSSKPPHYAELRLGLSAVQREREGEKQKEKERIENERRSCCSIELCLIGRAQEVWVTHSKINTLTQRRAGTQNERVARLLIRRQAEGPWILTGQQHVVAWWDSQPDDGMSQKEKMFLSSSNCSIIFLFRFSFQPRLPYTCSFALKSLICVLLLSCFWIVPLYSLCSALCFLSYFIWSQSIGVLFRTWWLPLAPCGCWLTAVGDCAGLMLGNSHRLLALLAEAQYCVCLNVLIVTLYSTHLLYCTSLWGTFTHPSSLCPLFLRMRGSDGKVEGGAEAREQNCHCGDDWQASCSTQT